MSGDADDLGGTECVEAVDEGDADLDLGGLSVWVPRGDALAKGLETAHLRLDPTSGVVSGPPLPECPTVVPRGAEGFVSGDCGGAVLLPRPTVLADRDDRRGLAVDDGCVASAGVIGAVSRHCADLFAFGIWLSSSGSTGLFPSLLGVNSTARMSEVAVSMARCTLRHWRRP